jgi:hypothetical protein
VVAGLQLGDRPEMAITVTANVDLDSSSTPWLAAALPLAMGARLPLEVGGGGAGPPGGVVVDGPVAPELLEAVPAITGLLASWYPELADIAVRATPAAGDAPRAAGVGCFFSGGVDSFYTVLSRQAEITHLIFVHGFDINVNDAELAERALTANRQIAADMGLPLIELWTDVRRVSDRYVDWGFHYHGAALAMIGLLLAPLLGEILVPASWNVDDLRPWGSHPDLDPLWTSSAVTFLHEGETVRRPRKVAFIADFPVAMDNLRVCWEGRHGAYNCGRCEKCLRTMVNFAVVGAEGKCHTLPPRVQPRRLRRLRLDRDSRTHAWENLAELDRQPDPDPELRAALRWAIRMSALYGPWEIFKQRLRRVLIRTR